MTPSLPHTVAEPDVTIVVPVYRNAATLPMLARRICQAMADAGWTFRLLLVVDASPDESWAVVRQLAAADPRVGGLLLAHNVGQHAAVLAGLRSACARWFVVMDADLQDAPEAIPALLAAAREHSTTVFARRCGRYERWDRLMTSRVFKSVLRWLVDMPADVGTFFVVTREVAEAMCQSAARWPQVVVLAHHCSRGSCTVTVRRATRPTGASAYSSLARVRAAVRGISCAVDCRRQLRPPAIRAARRLPPIAERINL